MARKRTYWNTTQKYILNCPSGFTGSYTVIKAERTYKSSISVADANRLALDAARLEANANIVCTVKPIDPPDPIPETWYKWCDEGQSVVVPDNTTVRYGQGNNWSTPKAMSGTVTANNETFGDPIPGVFKQLDATIPKPVNPDPGPDPLPPPSGETIVVDATTVLKADGVTDNGPALRKIRDTYRERAELVEIIVPAGVIVTWDNTWFRGLLKWKVTCNTGRFEWKHLGGNDWDVSHAPFLADGLFYPVDGQLGHMAMQHSSMFKTARQGDNFITLKNPNEISFFKKGSYQFLGGYECQGQGWPTNLRFFEWKYIADVNTNGVITFTEPLEHSYNEEWKDWYYGDGNVYSGKPRIHVIDPIYARYIELKGGKIIPQTGWNNNPANVSAIFVSADEIYLDDMDLDGNAIWPTANRIARYNNCRGGGWEGDKSVGTMIMTNCKVPSVWACTGIKNLIVKDSEFTSFSPMTPHNAYFENVRVNTGNKEETASIYSFSSWTGSNRWQYKNCVFSRICPPVAVTKMTVIPKDVANGTFAIPDDPFWDHSNHQFGKLCYQGSSVWSSDGSVRAKINDVVFRDGHYVVLFTPEKGTVVSNMTLHYKIVKEVVDLGGNRYDDGTPVIITGDY